MIPEVVRWPLAPALAVQMTFTGQHIEIEHLERMKEYLDLWIGGLSPQRTLPAAIAGVRVIQLAEPER